MKVVVIEPEFENGNLIDSLREKYDPSMSKIPYHITLVYPFQDNLTFEQLRTHVTDSLRGVEPFNVSLQGVSPSEDKYLFLDVTKGSSTIRNLQERLYTGPLKDYSNTPELRHPPHITIGRFNSKQELEKSLEEIGNFSEIFNTTIRNVSLAEIIEGQPPKVERINLE